MDLDETTAPPASVASRLARLEEELLEVRAAQTALAWLLVSLIDPDKGKEWSAAYKSALEDGRRAARKKAESRERSKDEA